MFCKKEQETFERYCIAFQMIFAHFERKKNGYIVEPRSEGTIKDPEKDMTFLKKYFKGFKRLWLDPSDCAYILSMGLKKIFFQESSEIRCIIDF